MSACLSLVLTAVRVGTWSDPTSVSAMKASVENTVRQVEHHEDF